MNTRKTLCGSILTLLVLVAGSGNAWGGPLATPTWRIDETLGTVFGDPAVFYTVHNGHPSASINAFAVGFNPTGFSGSSPANDPGWSSANLIEATWGVPVGALSGQSAQDFFGLTWAAFQALDGAPTTHAAIFNRNGGTNLLLPGTTVGATLFPTAAPAFIVFLDETTSPAVIKLSDGTVSGGPANQNNLFLSVPEPAALTLTLVGIGGFVGSRPERRRRAVGSR